MIQQGPSRPENDGYEYLGALTWSEILHSS